MSFFFRKTRSYFIRFFFLICFKVLTMLNSMLVASVLPAASDSWTYLLLHDRVCHEARPLMIWNAAEAEGLFVLGERQHLSAHKTMSHHEGKTNRVYSIPNLTLLKLKKTNTIARKIPFEYYILKGFRLFNPSTISICFNDSILTRDSIRGQQLSRLVELQCQMSGQ